MATHATLAERDGRFARLRSAMAQENLAALVVAGKGHWWTGRGYVRYLSDFHLWGHDGLILLPYAGEPALTLSSYAVAKKIASRGWITDTRGDVYLVPRLAEIMAERGLTRGRVGIAGLRWIMAAGTYEQLIAALPDVTFVSADDLFDRVRMIKSPLEIQQNRELWALAKSAMERFVEILEPGRTQRELAAEAARVALAGGARDLLIFIGESPTQYDPPEDVPLRCDDIVRFHMELCGPSGHWCELTVTCAYREPTELEARLLASELRACAALHQLARPGARLSALAAAYEERMRDDGWTLGKPGTHFDFHGQGMDTIERPWFAEETPWGQSQDWPLEEGMIFSFHPKRSVPSATGWSPGINEDILITENGADRLSGDWDLRWRMMK
ncbi:MAG: aminopeptidase P family protein [Chloroflexales bacterium]|nr:aminopeptidase P family protein [Chloroflexales bacterium]